MDLCPFRFEDSFCLGIHFHKGEILDLDLNMYSVRLKYKLDKKATNRHSFTPASFKD